MEIGEYIKQLRTKKGISQEELGKVVGVQRAAVQKWEAGKVQNLKRGTIKKLADYFNVSPVNFISNDDIIPNNIILSSHEKTVITAYRKHPEMQDAVDRLLHIESEAESDEEYVYLPAAARSKDNAPPQMMRFTKSQIEKLKNAPDFDDDL